MRRADMFSAQEVVTNEHVVAMMKAAIQDTQDLPLFVSQLFIRLSRSNI